MPKGNWQLAGNKGRSALIAIIDKLKKITPISIVY
jgi:hypothetical protein